MEEKDPGLGGQYPGGGATISQGGTAPPPPERPRGGIALVASPFSRYWFHVQNVHTEKVRNLIRLEKISIIF